MAPDRPPDPVAVAIVAAELFERRLDEERLDTWAARLGVENLLERARREAGA